MDNPDRKNRRQDNHKYVIIDGIRYRVDTLYQDGDDQERMQSFRKALKKELEILKYDHANLEAMYLSSDQRMSYRSFGLVECSFCQEGYRERSGNCPKCGHGPGSHKIKGCPDPYRTTEMIMKVVGSWKYKPMTKKAKKAIGES